MSKLSDELIKTYKEENQKLTRENKELKELLLFAKNNIADAMKIILEFKNSNILEKLHNTHYDICKKI